MAANRKLPGARVGRQTWAEPSTLIRDPPPPQERPPIISEVSFTAHVGSNLAVEARLTERKPSKEKMRLMQMTVEKRTNGVCVCVCVCVCVGGDLQSSAPLAWQTNFFSG